MIPVVLRAANRGADHVIGEDHHDDDNAKRCPAWRLDIFSPLVNEPQRRLGAAAVLDENEHDCDHGNRCAKHIEQQLGGLNARGLAAQFLR